MNSKVSKHLKEILVGKLLGDAHLETQNNGKTYRFKFEHSEKQKEYIFWLYKRLEKFCGTSPRIKTGTRNGKTYKKYFFQTKSFPNFVFFGKQFYEDKKKVIPKRIIRKLLTPLSVAVWFMDDGSVKSGDTNGRLFNTQGFSKKEVSLLSETLNNKFNLHTYLRKQKEGYQIFVPAQDAVVFYNLIRSFVLPMFQYKLPKLKSDSKLD